METTPETWQEKFDEQFSIGQGRKWIMTEEETKEVKQFIQTELEELAREILKTANYNPVYQEIINILEKRGIKTK